MSYHWTGPALGGNDEGWPGGPGYEPQGRTLWSGAVISFHSGKALDVAAGSNYDGAAVIQYAYKDTPNQLWDVIDAGRGRVIFVSQDSNKVLDVRGAGERDGDPVQPFRYNGNEDQLWRIERLGGGAYQIVNVASMPPGRRAGHPVPLPGRRESGLAPRKLIAARLSRRQVEDSR